MRARWVLLGGLTLIAVGLAVVLTRGDMRRASAPATKAQVEVARIVPGARACQADEWLSDAARALHVGGRVEGEAGARVRVELDGRESGAPRAIAQTSAPVVLPLDDGASSDEAIEVCIVNDGPGTVVLAGSQTGAEHQLWLVGQDGRRGYGAGRMRVEALLDERPASLWSTLGELPSRLATATGSVAAPWLAVGGLLVALAASVALFWRGDDEDRSFDA